MTPKQEAFCLAYLKTGNASQAYREAYDSKAMKPGTINRKAKDLIDNGKIAARLDELRKPIIEKAQITLESHLDKLEELGKIAEENKQFASAIKAEELRGKAAGLYKEKVEVSGPNGNPIQTQDVKDLTDEELDAELAKYGIEPLRFRKAGVGSKV